MFLVNVLPKYFGAAPAHPMNVSLTVVVMLYFLPPRVSNLRLLLHIVIH